MPPVRLFAAVKSARRVDPVVLKFIAQAGFDECMVEHADSRLLQEIAKGKYLVGVCWNHPQRREIATAANRGAEAAIAKLRPNRRLGSLLILPDFDLEAMHLAPVDMAHIALAHSAKALTLDLVRSGIFDVWIETQDDLPRSGRISSAGVSESGSAAARRSPGAFGARMPRGAVA